MPNKPAEMPINQWFYATLYGKEYNVDPLLLAAIADHETGYGNLGMGKKGYTLGYGATDSKALSQYAGIEKQYKYAAKKLGSYFQGQTVTQEGLNGFLRDSWKASDTGWANKVWSIYSGFGGGSNTPSNSTKDKTLLEKINLFRSSEERNWLLTHPFSSPTDYQTQKDSPSTKVTITVIGLLLLVFLIGTTALFKGLSNPIKEA